MPDIDVDREGERTTVHLGGDMANEPWLVQVLRLVSDDLANEEIRTIDLDLGRVTGFDIQCLAEVVGLAHEVQRSRRRFVVSGASPSVRRVLQHAEIADALS